MDSSRRLGFIVVFIVLLLLILAGCISTPFTKSGKSYIYQIPSIRERLGLSTGKSIPEKELSRLERKAYELFSKLYQENPELAEELGKIPDFADNEVSDKDLEALVNMIDYYFESKNPKIEEAVEQMLDVGIKGKRAYCSPLEVWKWLAEKHEFKEGSESYVNDPLSDYTLQRLIFAAWEFREEERWGDFKRVTNRLNSPELLASWIRDNLKYIPDPPRGRTQMPRETFRRKGGDCEDWAIFADYCLSKAGYNSYIISVMSHSVAVYKTDEGIFVIGDTARRWEMIYGPFKSDKEVVGGDNKRWRVSHWNSFKYP